VRPPEAVQHTTMNWSIRPFTPDLYPAIAEVHSAVYPENPSTAEGLRSEDERAHRFAGFQRWVAQVEALVVGYGEHGPALRSPDPHTFWADIVVQLAYRRRGIGSALYDLIIGSLGRFQARTLRIYARDDFADSIAFLERRGFREVMRTWDCRLDVPTFDFAPYQGLEDRLSVEDVTIRTLQELEGGPARNREVYELYREIHYDIPRPEPRVPDRYEEFVEKHLRGPDRPFFVAVRGKQYVGLHALTHRRELNQLYIEMTGVRRGYRRRGIALAMKLRGVAYAREHGVPTMKTFNESTNLGILAINERLGFVRLRATVDFVKSCAGLPAIPC